jgi:hypothetical protein
MSPAVAALAAVLAQLPLPKAALGPEAAPLRPTAESGVLANAASADNSFGLVTADGLRRMGRVVGYVRDYDDPRSRALRSGRGLLEVKTRAELFTSRAGAARGLAFWRGLDRRFGTLTGAGKALRSTEFRPVLGDEAFAIEYALSGPGRPTVYEVDILFRTGELLGSVSVAAADRGTLRARSVGYARLLLAKMLTRRGESARRAGRAGA